MTRRRSASFVALLAMLVAVLVPVTAFANPPEEPAESEEEVPDEGTDETDAGAEEVAHTEEEETVQAEEDVSPSSSFSLSLKGSHENSLATDSDFLDNVACLDDAGYSTAWNLEGWHLVLPGGSITQLTATFSNAGQVVVNTVLDKDDDLPLTSAPAPNSGFIRNRTKADVYIFTTPGDTLLSITGTGTVEGPVVLSHTCAGTPTPPATTTVDTTIIKDWVQVDGDPATTTSFTATFEAVLLEDDTPIATQSNLTITGEDSLFVEFKQDDEGNDLPAMGNYTIQVTETDWSLGDNPDSCRITDAPVTLGSDNGQSADESFTNYFTCEEPVATTSISTTVTKTWDTWSTDDYDISGIVGDFTADFTATLYDDGTNEVDSRSFTIEGNDSQVITFENLPDDTSYYIDVEEDDASIEPHEDICTTVDPQQSAGTALNSEAGYSFTNYVDCWEPLTVIVVEKEFSDDIDPEPDYRVELTTTELCYGFDDRYFLDVNEVEGDPCMTFDQSPGAPGNGGPIPLGSDGAYTVEETTSAAGYTARPGTVGDFVIEDPSTECEPFEIAETPVDAADESSGYPIIRYPVQRIPAYICTHTVINDPPTTTTTSFPSSASVTVDKVWEVNGGVVDAPAEAAPSFDVSLTNSLGTPVGGSPRTVADGGTASFPGLTTGATYDVSVDEDATSLPDPSVFAAEGEECVFVESTVELSSDTVTAPGSADATVTNAYECEPTTVLEEIEASVAVDIDKDWQAPNGDMIDVPDTVSAAFTVELFEAGSDVATATVTDVEAGELVTFDGLVDGDAYVVEWTETSAPDTFPLGDETCSVVPGQSITSGEQTFTAGATDALSVSFDAINVYDCEGSDVLEEIEERPDATEVADVEELGYTGSDSGTLLTLGLLLSMIGLAVLRFGRRREQTIDS